jgi:hypothetical protein
LFLPRVTVHAFSGSVGLDLILYSGGLLLSIWWLLFDSLLWGVLVLASAQVSGGGGFW